MNDLEKSRIATITELHGKFVGQFRKCLEYGIEIGGLLRDQKSELNHGEFGKWVTANLPFTLRTAQNYMRLHRERPQLLKSETVSPLRLKDAYLLLRAPAAETIVESKEEGWSLRNLSKDELLAVVSSFNKKINDKNHEIETDVSFFIEKLGDDPAVEDLAHIWHLVSHFCCYRQLAWTRGFARLPEGIRRYLAEFGKDDPEMLIKEPKPVCSGGCRNPWVLNPSKSFDDE
jgi:hypothetical protein